MLKDVGATLFALLQKMNESKIDFHLTGSRFYMTDERSSDWDFYTEQHAETIKFLLKNNFRSKGPYEGDFNVANVFEHHLGVHVQLVRDIKAKRRAQELLYPYRYLLKVKEVAKALWNIAQGL